MSAVLAMVDGHDEVSSVRALLRDWTHYRRRWRPHIGLPGAVAWLNHIRGGVDGWTEGDDYDIRIRANEMRQVDEAVRDLPADLQHAIYVVYLNEAGPAVWRSARKPMQEIRALCERAEVRLVPILRRRDIAL